MNTSSTLLSFLYLQCFIIAYPDSSHTVSSPSFRTASKSAFRITSTISSHSTSILLTGSWGKHYQVVHDIAALYITYPKYVYFNISPPLQFRSALNLRWNSLFEIPNMWSDQRRFPYELKHRVPCGKVRCFLVHNQFLLSFTMASTRMLYLLCYALKSSVKFYHYYL